MTQVEQARCQVGLVLQQYAQFGPQVYGSGGVLDDRVRDRVQQRTLAGEQFAGHGVTHARQGAYGVPQPEPCPVVGPLVTLGGQVPVGQSGE